MQLKWLSTAGLALGVQVCQQCVAAVSAASVFRHWSMQHTWLFGLLLLDDQVPGTCRIPPSAAQYNV
jgi:hypothetical protein